jgi:hypothetical protein
MHTAQTRNLKNPGDLQEGIAEEGWLRGVDLNHRPLGYE